MSLDFAREFAARVVPYAPDAWVNVHYTVALPNRDKPVWNGKPCKTPAEVERAVEYAMNGGRGRDIYLCMSSQRDAETKTNPKTGKQFKVALRNAANAVGHKSFYIDLDVKEGAYASTREALEALNAFRGVVDLPNPTLAVLSGSGGLHIHWIVDQVLTTQEWLPLAHALAAAIKRHGLKADTQCTVDAARILRIPQTLNHKSDPPKPVRFLGKPLEFDYTLERMRKALDPYVGAITLRDPTIRSFDPMLFPLRAAVENDELAAGVEDTRPLVDIEKIDCPFIIDALTHGGKDYGNPLWNLTTLIATFCADGRAQAHRMASGHVTYSMETTEQLYERKEREKKDKGLGWPSCKTIDVAGCAQCATCPHKDGGKTPLSFHATPTIIAPTPGGTGLAALDLLPEGYHIDLSGMVWRQITLQDGSFTDRQVFKYPIQDAFVQGGARRSLNFTAVEGSGVLKLSIPFDVICNKEALSKTLALSMPMLDEDLKEARKFMISWTERLIMAKDVVVSTPAFGWVDGPKGISGFSFGGCAWGAGGHGTPAIEADHEISRQYGVVGALQPWLDAANMVLSRESPALNALLLSGFTAPLVKLLGFRGLLMSLYSQESGIGKTTTMQVAQAVWGSPRMGIQQLQDTQMSVFDRVAKIKSLPVYWDEIKTEEEIKQFVGIIFQLTSGRGKSRLRSDLTQRERGLWDTLMVSCSNDTVLDHVASANNTTLAGIYRVFEFAPPPPTKGQIGIGEAMRTLAKLDNNYGHMGLEFAKYLGDNHARVYADIGARMAALEEMTRCTQAERNWVGLIACLMQAARCVNEMGHINIPETDLLDFLLEQLENMRSQAKNQTVDMRNTQNVSDILGRFFAATRARNTLVTDRVYSGRGRPKMGSIKVYNDLAKLDILQVHMGIVDRTIKVDRTALRTWLKDHNYSQGVVIDEIRKQFRMREDVGALGSGTLYSTVSMNVFTFDCVGTALDDLIREDPTK